MRNAEPRKRKRAATSNKENSTDNEKREQAAKVLFHCDLFFFNSA